MRWTTASYTRNKRAVFESQPAAEATIPACYAWHFWGRRRGWGVMQTRVSLCSGPLCRVQVLMLLAAMKRRHSLSRRRWRWHVTSRRHSSSSSSCSSHLDLLMTINQPPSTSRHGTVHTPGCSRCRAAASALGIADPASTQPVGNGLRKKICYGGQQQ